LKLAAEARADDQEAVKCGRTRGQEMTELETRDGVVKSVDRCIDILFILTERPMTLTEVASRSRLSKSTALRLLATLAHGGLVIKDPLAGNYQLGPGCLTLGHGFMNGQGSLAALAREPLQALREKTGETVAVHVRLGRQRVCVDEIPGPHGVRYVAEIGASAPIYLGSAGRILLAFMAPAELDTLIGGIPLIAPANDTVIDESALRKELALVRRRGYAMSEGERIPGASAISVPIIGPDGLVASLSILGPSERLSLQARLAALPQLTETAAAMSASLMMRARASSRES
jgi:DNA-binding IclR family transcriptional regulator